MKRVLMLLGSLAVVLAITQSAHAIGIGFYGTGGVSFMNWTYKGEENGSSTDYFYGGGLIIDSNVATNKIFNYRFTAGYEQYKLKNPNTGEVSKPYNQISMSHTFGFGTTLMPNIRIWAGPQIGFHYNFVEYNVTPYYYTLYGIQFRPPKVDVDGLGLDILLAMGINYNIGDNATVFFDLGFGYMGLYNLKNSKEIGNSLGLQAKAGFMYRINDSYKQTPPVDNIKMQDKDIQ